MKLRFGLKENVGVLFAALSCISVNAGAVCFVDRSAGGRNDGSNWVDAYTDLQSALANKACSEIWAAMGVYKPTASADTTISFAILPHTQVYGGFSGTETTRDQRDVDRNVTVLSGDIGGDDANAATTQIDLTWEDIGGSNTLEVVLMDGMSGHPIEADTTLDGFTISGGSCDSSLGGGLMCLGEGTGGKCNPTLSNLVFSGNGSDYCLGGAVFADGYGGESSPQFSRVVFHGNDAYDGAAVYADGSSDGYSAPSFTSVTFGYNWANQHGGAVYIDGSSAGHGRVNVFGTIFDSNGASLGGALASEDSDAGIVDVSIDSSTFQENRSGGDGGAIHLHSAGGFVNASLVNSTFYRNEARHAGGAINLLSELGATSCGAINLISNNMTVGLNAAVGNMLGLDDAKGGALAVHAEPGCTADARVLNSIFWGNYVVWDGPGQEVWMDSGSVSFDHSVIEHGCPMGTSCSSTSEADPLLSDFGYYFAPTMLMRPGVDGSAIDAGDDATCASVDQRGFSRPQGSHCDIGAVERRFPSDDLSWPTGF